MPNKLNKFLLITCIISAGKSPLASPICASPTFEEENDAFQVRKIDYDTPGASYLVTTNMCCDDIVSDVL